MAAFCRDWMLPRYLQDYQPSKLNVQSTLKLESQQRRLWSNIWGKIKKSVPSCWYLGVHITYSYLSQHVGPLVLWGWREKRVLCASVLWGSRSACGWSGACWKWTWQSSTKLVNSIYGAWISQESEDRPAGEMSGEHGICTQKEKMWGSCWFSDGQFCGKL